MIKVFIVEDDPMVLEVNKSFLEQLTFIQYMGHADTGESALRFISNNKVDLVLLDIYLPGIMSGVDLLYEIRKANIKTDVIALTAARDSKTIHELFRLGTIDYLVKPFRFERFEAALKNYERMWDKLRNGNALSQEDIDSWSENNKVLRDQSLPKGLSDTTLKQIFLELSKKQDSITAENLANSLGLARVTVRRYLDYLDTEGRVKIEMKYGSVGRPTHYYSI